MGAFDTKDPMFRALGYPFLLFVVVLVFITSHENARRNIETPIVTVDESGSTQSTQPPVVPGPISQCERIPQGTLWNVQRVNQFSVFIFNEGEIITGPVDGPLKVCVLAVVPQESREYYTDLPIRGRGPDDIHLLINSSTTTITSLPLLPRAASDQRHQELFYHGSLLYDKEVDILDPGFYQIQAEQEWSNWRWSRQFEILNDSVRVPTRMQVKFSSDAEKQQWLNAPVIQNTVPAFWISPPTLTVHGKPRDLAARPICGDATEAAQGRWIVNKNNANPWTRDEWGWTWEPDGCRIEYYSDEDIFDCLERTNIHVYGNSNLRRIAKTILSGGQWCTDVFADCQNNDSQEREILTLKQDGSRLAQTTHTLDNKWTFTDEPPVHIPFGRRANLHFMFLRALSEFPRDWVRHFFSDNYFTQHPRGVHGAFTTDMIHANSSITVPKGMANASNPEVVLVGFASWDAAFDSSLDSLASALPIFRDTLLTVFPYSHIVLRLANGMCCKKDWGYYKQRYTGQRIAHVNDMIRDIFDDTRFSILDPGLMSGRPEVPTQYGEVYTNHPRVSHVRIETQMLVNAICEKRDLNDGRGTKAVLRRTKGLALRDAQWNAKLQDSESDSGSGSGSGSSGSGTGSQAASSDSTLKSSLQNSNSNSDSSLESGSTSGLDSSSSGSSGLNRGQVYKQGDKGRLFLRPN